MPRKMIDRDALASKETFTKSDVQDILIAYTNCLRETFGKALSFIVLNSDAVKEHIRDVMENGNDSMHALDKMLDNDNAFDGNMIISAEAGKAIIGAMNATIKFSKDFLKDELNLRLPEIREIETYIDTNDNQFDNRIDFSNTVRAVAEEIMDGSTMGSQDGWDYAVDTSRKGAWITVLTHPKYNEVRLVMVDKNEIDPDSDTLEYIQKQFNHITGTTNKTIH